MKSKAETNETVFLDVHIRGLTPCIMQADTLADPLNAAAKRLSALAAKKTGKTDEDRREMAEIEFLNSIYYDKTVGPYWPDVNIERCLRDAAKLTRQGRNVQRGLKVVHQKNELLYDGPRSPRELIDNSNFRYTRSVVVSGRRVMRTRPIFEEWELKFVMTYDTGIFKDLASVEAIIRAAGKYIGLSTYRPKFGLFEVVSINEVGREESLHLDGDEDFDEAA